jgi:hypothetical protein
VRVPGDTLAPGADRARAAPPQIPHMVVPDLNVGDETGGNAPSGPAPAAPPEPSTRGQLLKRPLVIVMVVAAALATVISRPPVLRAVGHLLVVDETVERADVIVVGVDAAAAGVLEAVDLVHAGVSSRVAVFEDPPDTVDQEFIRRGVPYEDAAERSERQLRAFGITAVERIGRAGGSEEEAIRLPEWCTRQKLAAIVVVTTPDHSQRLRRILRRSMDGHGTKVSVKVARHATFDPERWWQTRGGLRIGIIELQKLLLDVVRHPLP